MIYNQYGKTGARVSAVGFGGMRFDTSRSNEENAELLPYAFSKGINYFDTAPGYCDDKSEDIFGLALKQMADVRDEFYVTSKGMPADFDTAGKACKAVEKSLKRLNIDKIDFYHVWCVRDIEQYHLAMKKGGQYEGLVKCRDEGLIDNIVVSTHLPGDKVSVLLEKGYFEGVLLGVNILNFLYRWQGVQAAYDTGLGVVAMNPLSGGIIPKHEEKLAFLAGPSETPTQAALRFNISCPQITVTLVGITTKEHIDTACQIADNCKPFTQADIDRVKANISENMDSICTGCGYCIPHCDQHIPVADYMQCYNEKLLADKTDEEMGEVMTFNHEWGLLADAETTAKECTQCGKCQEACTQHLNIVERLEHLAKWEKESL